MENNTIVRHELIGRMDSLAQLLEDVATEAVNGDHLELATDLWVASARILAAADELSNPNHRYSNVRSLDNPDSAR